MIALETNVLVAAGTNEHPMHRHALPVVRDLAAGARSFAVPWPVVHEFLAVMTNPRIWHEPTAATVCLRGLRSLLAAPAAHLLGESAQHLETLQALVARPGVVGPKVHDARIAAICLDHGVRELLTADRDFSLFPELVTRNPFV